jgi:DNA-binding NarL/FixJ family response regulator
MISIAIAEDKPDIAEILKEKIELNPEFKVTFVAENGDILLQYLKDNRHIEVLLLDINMPVLDGIQTATEIAKLYPQMKMVMCTVFDDEENIFNAIRAGANGYILKDCQPAVLHRYLLETLDGGAPMSPLIARKALKLLREGKLTTTEKPSEFDLTAREIELLNHLSTGLTYEQIAENLHISHGTVRTHFRNAYKKLNVNNKTEAINIARLERLI